MVAFVVYINPVCSTKDPASISGKYQRPCDFRLLFEYLKFSIPAHMYVPGRYPFKIARLGNGRNGEPQSLNRAYIELLCMNSETVQEKRPVMSSWKIRILGGLVSSLPLAAAAMAGNITDGVSPVITDVTELLPILLALVIAALPIIVALSVIGFLLGMFDGILSKIKM